MFPIGTALTLLSCGQYTLSAVTSSILTHFSPNKLLTYSVSLRVQANLASYPIWTGNE